MELAQQQPYGEVLVPREQFDQVGRQGRTHRGAAPQPGMRGGRTLAQDIGILTGVPHPVQGLQACLGLHDIVDGGAFPLGQFRSGGDDEPHVRVRVGGRLPHRIRWSHASASRSAPGAESR